MRINNKESDMEVVNMRSYNPSSFIAQILPGTAEPWILNSSGAKYSTQFIHLYSFLVGC